MSVTQIRGDTQLQNNTLTNDSLTSRTTDLTLATVAASNGNIELQPDGTGIVHSTKDITVDTQVNTDEVKSRTGDLTLQPLSDSTTAIKLQNAAGTTNILTLGTNSSKLTLLEVGASGTVFQMSSDHTSTITFGNAAEDTGFSEIDTDSSGNISLASRLGTGVVSVYTDNYAFQWAFDPTGKLTVPGQIDMNNFNIINLLDPVNPQDAVTKAYADSISAGLDPKASSRVGTLVDVPGYTTSPDNGELTIPNGNATYFPNAGAAAVIDGITLTTGDRVLVKNQIDAKQNGIYSVADPGVQGTTDAVLNRSIDMDGTPSNEVSGGNFTFVEAGTQAGTGWVVVWDGTVTLNTDPVNWTQFSSSTSVVYVAGAGLTQTGVSTVTFDVVSSNTGITVNSDDIALTLATSSGLEISSGLRVKTDTVTANTIGVTRTTNGSGILFDANSFADSGSETLALASGVAGAGLALTTGVLSVNTGNGTVISSDAVVVNLSAISGLEFSSAALQVKTDTTTANTIGVTHTANGSGILYSSTNFSESSETLQLKTAGVLYANTNIITREVPSGTIDGSNLVFTLANSAASGSEEVFLNGLLQNAGSGNDYTISGDTITFETGNAPQTGSVLLVTYWKA